MSDRSSRAVTKRAVFSPGLVLGPVMIERRELLDHLESTTLKGDWLAGSVAADAFEFSTATLRFCLVLRQACASAIKSIAANATDSFKTFIPSSSSVAPGITNQRLLLSAPVTSSLNLPGNPGLSALWHSTQNSSTGRRMLARLPASAVCCGIGRHVIALSRERKITTPLRANISIVIVVPEASDLSENRLPAPAAPPSRSR